MPIRSQEIINACQVVAEQDGIEVCMTETLKGVGVASGVALIAGLIFGRKGIAVGSGLGGLLGSYACKDYKPLYRIIQEMNETDRARLVNHMRNIMRELDITDAIALATLVAAPDSAAFNVFSNGLRSYASSLARG